MREIEIGVGMLYLLAHFGTLEWPGAGATRPDESPAVTQNGDGNGPNGTRTIKVLSSWFFRPPGVGEDI